DDHQIGLARRRAEDFGAEPRDVVPRGGGRHHLDRAAREAEAHRPDRRLARPVEHAIDACRDEVVLETMVYKAHARDPCRESGFGIWDSLGFAIRETPDTGVAA